MRLPRPTRSVRRRAAVAVTTALSAVLVAGTLTAAPAQAGVADRKKQVDRRVDDARDDLEDTAADLRQAYERLQSTQAQLPAARARLGRANQAVADAAARDREIGGRLAVAKAAVAKAEDDLAATARSTDDTHDALGGLARQAYQSGGFGELSVAMSAQSADEFANRVELVDQAMRIQGRTLADLDVARAETTAKRTRLTAVRQQVAALKAEAEANVETARRAQAEAAAAQAAVQDLVASQQRDVSTIESKKAAERQRLAGLEAQQRQLEHRLAEIAAAARRAAAAKAKRERASSKAPSSSGGGSSSSSSGGGSVGGYLSRPVSGGWISSEFGRRFHPILHYWRLHAGMDFAVGCGTPVHAAASGSIVSAGWGGGYGNRIVVSHGIERGVGLATTYNHLSRIVVHGGHVSRGQLIGYSGTTGSSTGCHLHFETYENGTPVNPRRWI
ncbi:peptidoglycan DD-metalloendopeptidase family protein [Angustibacter aerolatus]